MANKNGSSMHNQVQIKASIDRMLYDANKSLKAFASATVGAFAVHGLRVYERTGEHGKEIFVGMPQNSYKNAKGEMVYQDIFHPITAESREQLCKAVADAYVLKLQQASEKQVEVPQTNEEMVQKM